MPRLLLLFLTLLITFTGAGCGLLRRKKPQPPSPASPKVVIGRVEMVNPELKFALIHTIERAAIPAGSDLITANEAGETARLKMSPERKGVFMTADIVSGEPMKGETVIWMRGSDPTAVAPPPAPVVEPSARISIPSSTPAPPEPPTASITPPPAP